MRLKGQVQGTNQFIEGIGVLLRRIGALGTTSLFTNIGLQVFDGQRNSKSPVSLEAVFARMAASPTSDPSLYKIEDSAFPAPPEEAAGSTVLRDGAQEVLNERRDKFLSDYFKE